MTDPNAPQQNRLLAALSFAERERVCPHLRLVQMPLGKVLCEPGAVLQNVYFPTDSVISQVYVTADGASAQVSSVGERRRAWDRTVSERAKHDRPRNRTIRRFRVLSDEG